MMEFKLGCYKDPNTSLTWPSVSPRLQLVIIQLKDVMFRLIMISILRRFTSLTWPSVLLSAAELLSYT